MKQVLFIGGDADGIRRMVHDSTSSIESNEGRYFIHEYLTDRETLHFATQSEEADTCEIMQALFARYQQPIQSDGTGGVRQRCWEVYTDKNQPHIIKQLMHIVIHHIGSQAQRAEAAEATIKQQGELILSYQETIRQQTEKLAEEKRINLKLREDRAGLSRECNAFEAKLDELAKQEAVAFINAPRKAKMLYAGERLPVDTNLYARPAPAVSLAELVPDKKSTDIDYAYYPLTKARHEGYNECVDDILRNIEEQGK